MSRAERLTEAQAWALLARRALDGTMMFGLCHYAAVLFDQGHISIAVCKRMQRRANEWVVAVRGPQHGFVGAIRNASDNLGEIHAAYQLRAKFCRAQVRRLAAR